MYTEIKNNIIKNFFNKEFRYAYGCRKEAIIEKIQENSIFNVKYNYSTDILTMNLGDNIVITFECEWEYTTHQNNLGKEMKRYKLINIK